MATQVQFRRGTTAQNASFTGALGEVTVDTDKDTLVVHDGGTAGCFEISRADASNLTFPDGAVGTPAISFASDTNTGIYRGGTDILKFVTAGTDAITIDASQNVDVAGDLTVDTYTLYVDSTNNRVGIGTSSLTSKFEVAVSDNTAIQEAITIKGTQTGAYGGYLGWKDNWSGDSYTGYRGAIISDVPSANNGRMKFFIADSGSLSQAMTLDSSGNLLVGTTTVNPADNNDASGSQLSSIGSIQASVSNATPAIFNRGADGGIIGLLKAGVGVGSIGTLSSRLHIENGDTGLRIAGDLDQIFPCGSGGSDRDNAIDLGSSGVRFKDLFLSGGVYLGGTGTANYLDDYEEGTFTLSVTTAGYTLTDTAGFYTKIGRQVTVVGFVKFDPVGSDNSSVSFSGLPFASDALDTDVYYTGVAREDVVAGDIFVAQNTRGTSNMSINSMDGVGSGQNQIFVANRSLSFNLTYFV